MCYAAQVKERVIAADADAAARQRDIREYQKNITEEASALRRRHAARHCRPLLSLQCAMSALRYASAPRISRRVIIRVLRAAAVIAIRATLRCLLLAA